MTKDDYLRIARESGFEEISQDEWAGFSNTIESFASAVAALEREECAKVSDSIASDYSYASEQAQDAADQLPCADKSLAALECAAAIRNKDKK
jgi:hypothetical protein